jgi:hypothetical protein
VSQREIPWIEVSCYTLIGVLFLRPIEIKEKPMPTQDFGSLTDFRDRAQSFILLVVKVFARVQ